MKRSNPARMCLENLAASRGSQDRRRTLGAEWVENELIKVVQHRGEESLNALRDEARELAPKLRLEKEYAILNKMVSAILNSHPVEGVLQTRSGIAQAKAEPFDQSRLQRFQGLADYLKKLNLSENPYTYSKSSWRNISFFESYFSNYIEGTEFTVEEAEEIVFEKKADPKGMKIATMF